MFRICNNNGRLVFQFVSFTKTELDMLEDMLHQFYGKNPPKYTYFDLAQLRESVKLDVLEGVIYADTERIEKNIKRLVAKGEL